MINETDLNKIWFVVSPLNPLKNSKSLLNENHRLQLVRLATEEDTRLKASDIEFHLPRPSYTIDTMIYLEEKYPDHHFHIIMGSDSFSNIEKWKNYKLLIKNYPLLIYKRNGFPVKTKTGGNIRSLESPLLDISATHIRELIRDKKSIRYLVPESVREEIEVRRFYQ